MFTKYALADVLSSREHNNIIVFDMRCNLIMIFQFYGIINPNSLKLNTAKTQIIFINPNKTSINTHLYSILKLTEVHNLDVMFNTTHGIINDIIYFNNN